MLPRIPLILRWASVLAILAMLLVLIALAARVDSLAEQLGNPPDHNIQLILSDFEVDRISLVESLQDSINQKNNIKNIQNYSFLLFIDVFKITFFIEFYELRKHTEFYQSLSKIQLIILAIVKETTSKEFMSEGAAIDRIVAYMRDLRIESQIILNLGKEAYREIVKKQYEDFYNLLKIYSAAIALIIFSFLVFNVLLWQQRREATRLATEAITANRAKTQFIATVSHELRTPLNGVIGSLDLLTREMLTPRQRQLVDTGLTSAEIALWHINDLIELGRFQTGRQVASFVTFSLNDLIAEIGSIGALLARLKGNQFEVSIDQRLGQVRSDPHRIRQVLLNLVSNACKFTSNGEVSIQAHCLSEEDGHLNVEISVIDNGPGIDETNQRQIFEDYVTFEPLSGRLSAGSGLGLGICRRIVNAMGGTITVNSKPGRGSRFSVTLPLEKVSEQASQISNSDVRGPADRDGGGRRKQHLSVLLVEDNETSRFLMREMLETEGHRVVEASDGLDGVTKASREAFDIILMDINLPLLDGMEATRRIRGASGPSQSAFIVGLTAHAMPEDTKRFADAGMNRHLTKPLRMEALLALLRHGELASSTRADPGAAPTAERVADLPELVDGAIMADLGAALPGAEFASLLHRLDEEIENQVAALRQAILEGDLSTAAPVAHKLAGSAAVVGAGCLQRHLARIETACRAGRNDEARELALSSLSALVDDTRALLAAFRDASETSPPCTASTKLPIDAQDGSDSKEVPKQEPA